jgi:hypothetical protein
MGRLSKGETPKVWKTVSMEEKAAELLGIAGTVLSEKLGFRPSISQTILFLVKHYERTEGK